MKMSKYVILECFFENEKDLCWPTEQMPNDPKQTCINGNIVQLIGLNLMIIFIISVSVYFQDEKLALWSLKFVIFFFWRT